MPSAAADHWGSMTGLCSQRIVHGVHQRTPQTSSPGVQTDRCGYNQSRFGGSTQNPQSLRATVARRRLNPDLPGGGVTHSAVGKQESPQAIPLGLGLHARKGNSMRTDSQVGAMWSRRLSVSLTRKSDVRRGCLWSCVAPRDGRGNVSGLRAVRQQLRLRLERQRTPPVRRAAENWGAAKCVMNSPDAPERTVDSIVWKF